MVTKSTVFRRAIPKSAVVEFLKTLDIDLEDPELVSVEHIIDKTGRARNAFLVFEPFYYTHSFKERLQHIENKTKLINVIRELAKSQGYMMCSSPSFEKTQVKFYSFVLEDKEISRISLLPETLEKEFEVVFS